MPRKVNVAAVETNLKKPTLFKLANNNSKPVIGGNNLKPKL